MTKDLKVIDNSSPSSKLPILFLHGSFANKKSWRRIQEKLGQEYSSIAIDLPGHGDAPSPEDYEKPSVSAEFDMIENTISENDNYKNGFHLIGHSYGGVVALKAALSRNFPIKKLTLFEPVAVNVFKTFGLDQAMYEVDVFVESYLRQAERGDRYACARIFDFWGGTGSFDQVPDHLKDIMVSMTGENIRHWYICNMAEKKKSTFHDLMVPMQIINGSRSNETAKLIATTVQENVPDCRLYDIKGASHFMITSHVDECVEIIRKF